MVSKVKTATVSGISAEMIEVEADVAPGIPAFDLTGNLGTIAKEARERVRTALRNSDVYLNPARYTINLAPANLRKEGPHFDLAIAIAVLQLIGIVIPEETQDVFFAGELGLDGRVNPVNAILPMVCCAREHGCKIAVIPSENAPEGAYVDGIEVIGINTLTDCIRFLGGGMAMEATKPNYQEDMQQYDVDFSDVKGQENLKRAAMISAASMHNLFMIGPPGAGKTMIASRMPTILPRLTDDECMSISKIYSVAGLLRGTRPYITKRPFRAPHHICTPTAMAGGGVIPTPGEISLADHGVLFLDELNLFNSATIEVLRQPLESGTIHVTRLSGTVEYPAEFMLIAAMNPCKCGYYPDRSKCNCTPMEIRKYFGKISRPILDRFDVCVNVPKATYEEVSGVEQSSMNSETMREQVTRAVAIQAERFASENYHLNSQIPGPRVKHYCELSKEANRLLELAYKQYDLSARSYYRILRVSRTIADLSGEDRIQESHVSEAIAYKMI